MSTLLERAKNITNGATILASWLGTGGVTVPYNVAQSRAHLCLKCPKKEPCPPFEANAAEAVKRVVELKNKLQLRVRGEKDLGCCSACGCVNKLKTWLTIDKIKREMDEAEMGRLDANCWILKEGV